MQQQVAQGMELVVLEQQVVLQPELVMTPGQVGQWVSASLRQLPVSLFLVLQRCLRIAWLAEILFGHWCEG